MPKKITRAEAKAIGLKRFFTGVACKNGHVSHRYVSTGRCVQCTKERNVRASDIKRKFDRDKYKACPKERARKKKNHQDFAKNNPALKAKLARSRETLMQYATPDWIDWDLMNAVYFERGDNEQTDHFYPLKHPEFCGWNVPWNLQNIPDTENLAKGNKRPEDFYGFANGIQASLFYDLVCKPECLKDDDHGTKHPSRFEHTPSRRGDDDCGLHRDRAQRWDIRAFDQPRQEPECEWSDLPYWCYVQHVSDQVECGLVG